MFQLQFFRKKPDSALVIFTIIWYFMDELQRERNFMPEKKPLIQVLDRALDLMEMLARSKTPLRATDIAREMGLSLQSANNLLRAR